MLYTTDGVNFFEIQDEKEPTPSNEPRGFWITTNRDGKLVALPPLEVVTLRHYRPDAQEPLVINRAA